MQGSCLCQAVAFRVRAPLPQLYQCHCSLCRKITGSAHNTALIVAKKQFSWIRGSKHIVSYQCESGYRNDFCGVCGCSVPNTTKSGDSVWIPAGLMGDIPAKVVAHLYVDSKASWDDIPSGAAQFAERPDITTLIKTLQCTDA